MKASLLDESAGGRTFMVVLATGDEAMTSLMSFAREHDVSAGHFTAIGAFSNAVVGYFDWEKKVYREIPISEQVEVLSLIGDISLADDTPSHHPKVHAHVVLGTRDAAARGGHLLSGHVRPTLEVVVTESPRHLRRRYDRDSGLALIDPTL
jgi:predicted DNA-binding protein with PD1-like motif